MNQGKDYDLIIEQLETHADGPQMEYFSDDEINANVQLQQGLGNFVILLTYIEILLYLSLFLFSQYSPNLINQDWTILLLIFLFLLIRFGYIIYVSTRIAQVMNMGLIDAQFTKNNNMLLQSRANLVKLIAFTLLLLFLDVDVALVSSVFLILQSFYFLSKIRSITQARYPIFTNGIWYKGQEIQQLDVIMTKFPIFVNTSSVTRPANVIISSSSLKYALDKYPYNFSNYFLDLNRIFQTNSPTMSLIKYWLSSVSVPYILGSFFYLDLQKDFSFIYLIFAFFLILNLIIVGGINIRLVKPSEKLLTRKINQYFDARDISFERRIEVLQDYLNFRIKHDTNLMKFFKDRFVTSRLIIANAIPIRANYTIQVFKRIIDHH